MTKAYSKIAPAVWFDLLADQPDEHGMYPAFIHSPEGEGYFVVHGDSISFREIAPVPESVPDVVFGILRGDPMAPQVDIVFTEREARIALAGLDVLGYFPLHVERVGLISD